MAVVCLLFATIDKLSQTRFHFIKWTSPSFVIYIWPYLNCLFYLDTLFRGHVSSRGGSHVIGHGIWSGAHVHLKIPLNQYIPTYSWLFLNRLHAVLMYDLERAFNGSIRIKLWRSCSSVSWNKNRENYGPVISYRTTTNLQLLLLLW